jgi:hypothetical protein
MDALKKKLIVIALTVLVFLSAVVLGVATVFRVHSVTVVSSVVSDEAKAEAQELKNRLQEVYDKDSIFFADDEDAKKVLEEFPYFRITSFEKDYPNRIIIKVTEDAEVFAVQSGEQYYVLGIDGTILSVRGSSLNRSDGKNNVLVTGFEISGEKGEKFQGERLALVLPLLQELSSRLGGLRSNLTEVSFSIQGGSIEEYCLQTTEGVRILVRKVDEFTKEKGQMIAETYSNLSDADRLTGVIFATNNESKATVVYSPMGNFQ